MALLGQRLPEHFMLGQAMSGLAWAKMAGIPKEMQMNNYRNIKMILTMAGIHPSIEQKTDLFFQELTGPLKKTLLPKEVIDQMSSLNNLFSSWINDYLTEKQIKAFNIGFYSSVAVATCSLASNSPNQGKPLLVWALTILTDKTKDIGLVTQHLKHLLTTASTALDGYEFRGIKIGLNRFNNECIRSALRRVNDLE